MFGEEHEKRMFGPFVVFEMRGKRVWTESMHAQKEEGRGGEVKIGGGQ